MCLFWSEICGPSNPSPEQHPHLGSNAVYTSSWQVIPLDPHSLNHPCCSQGLVLTKVTAQAPDPNGILCCWHCFATRFFFGFLVTLTLCSSFSTLSLRDLIWAPTFKCHSCRMTPQILIFGTDPTSMILDPHSKAQGPLKQCIQRRNASVSSQIWSCYILYPIFCHYYSPKRPSQELSP